MSHGILFFSNYSEAVPLFAVAVHSLRKHYSGPIHIVLGSDSPDFFVDILNKQYDVTVSFMENKYYDKKSLKKLQKKG